MIITTEEFKEMGFVCADEDLELLDGCIKRAEYVLSSLCGRDISQMLSEKNEKLIKQALAFQSAVLLNESRGGKLSRVSVGDFSYTEDGGQKSAEISPTAKRLLCAAGCLTSIAEVAE